jgi:hypothetical protein
MANLIWNYFYYAFVWRQPAVFYIFSILKEINMLVKFFKKILFFIIPFIILLVIYLILDPFKVVKSYSSYYISDEINGVGLNRGFVSTKTFENNFETNQYNSFIFGNSRSIFYEIDDWRKHLEPESNCFHFDASSESLYGIYKKFLYLAKKGVDIKNALIILDYSTLAQTVSNQGHLFIISPQLEDNINILPFHLSFIRTFFNPLFMAAYFDYKITGKIKEYMKRNNFLDDSSMHYDPKTNEITYLKFEFLISRGEYYNTERMSVFYHRTFDLEYSPIVISDKQEKMLYEIKKILQEYKTKYKIIINPLYDQQKLNTRDLVYLNIIFGSDNVYDFSGINAITNDYNNYYENSHYRPHVARMILREIYN